MLEGKTVLLTGGTGSFGRGFVRKLLDAGVHMVRVYSRDEHKQNGMRKEYPNKVSFYIGDVRDKDRLKRAMSGCDVVVHAAALKQAPLGEIEPQEFVKTNVLGSINVVESAMDCGIGKALLISTDKAVEPINLYGATKMCAEKIFLGANAMRSSSSAAFSCVRYGNVACTNGSIIPKLLALLPHEPSPIYDKDATRFWIGLKEAHDFVIQSLMAMKGGEVFIPRLKSVRVMDIIRAVRPGRSVEFLDPRPGDKTHEVLNVDGCRMASNRNEFMTVQEIKDYVFGNGDVLVQSR